MLCHLFESSQDDNACTGSFAMKDAWNVKYARDAHEAHKLHILLEESLLYLQIVQFC